MRLNTIKAAAAGLSPLILLVVVSALLPFAALADDGSWHTGRATYYGDEPWYWTIHHGSCGFNYLWPDHLTGWDVAALSDAHPNYAGSCGRCFEVRCAPQDIVDGYGKKLDRSKVCHQGSVVVHTTDTCPCNYPGNYYSNKRWCCGDMPHFDLSIWAFKKLSESKWGVIPIQYREVDCSHRPDHAASGPTFPGVFPPMSLAKSRPDFSWSKYFPDGGFTDPSDGTKCEKISTDEFLRRLWGGGGNSGGSNNSNSGGSGGDNSGSGDSSKSGGSSGDGGSGVSGGHHHFWGHHGR